MTLSLNGLRPGHGTGPWPVLILLLIVVLLPTLGVLWFMNQAMKNEQFAVRQRLSDVYRSHLILLQEKLHLEWQSRSAALDSLDPSLAAPQIFALHVRAGIADSLVVYEPTHRASYPQSQQLDRSDRGTPNGAWRRAERLEHSGENKIAAAGYAVIAERASDPNLAARALLAQARCLVKAELLDAAISILSETLSRQEYSAAIDADGRLIAPNAKLRALELLAPDVESDPKDLEAAMGIAKSLAERLKDYGPPQLPSAQRLFLMRRLITQQATQIDRRAFDTLAAEQLAEGYLDAAPPAPFSTSLQPSGLPEVWHLASPSGAVVALFHQRELNQKLEFLTTNQSLPENTAVELLAPGVEPDEQFVVSLPVGGFLQGWQLVLRPEDQTLFATAAKQRINAYLLTGFLVVVVIVLLAMLVARTVSRQMRLTRLKSDLLSTVSHELKTPLASMRLLVDTMLETGTDDATRVREYLELLAKENARLSRLVDNFLTFSRMEQHSRSFAKRNIAASEVVEAAAASVAERFSVQDCHFEFHVEPDLPRLFADHDALVTVLLNLLDNAFKYSAANKRIELSCYADNQDICFSIGDNGVGLSSRAVTKIFDRFYQVDQRLARASDGCGLGLSIVDLIVNAHGGTMDVQSKLGSGSTFTVRLPTLDSEDGS